MLPVEIVAVGAISALGRGPAAYSVGGAGAVPSCAARPDAELTVAGLGRPHCARAALPAAGPARAEALLASAFDELTRDLEQHLPDWGTRALGLAVGTSAGGMPSLLEVFEARDRSQALARDLALAAPYFGPLRVLGGLRPVLFTQVLAACASSTVALGLACRWLDAGHVDLAIAGGYDALSVFVAAGFEALGAVSAGLPQPFRQGRDGMVLGEGAALLALARAGDAPSGKKPGRRGYGFILGFGASSDAVHVTAPDRTGRGLRAAAQAALADAGTTPDRIDVVSAHATATPYNDAAEARVIDAVFEDRASRIVVHPYKAVIGHTLGAAGALELLAGLSSLRQELLPAAVGSGPLDEAFGARLLDANQPAASGPLGCLKLSAAFGGGNAALVAATGPGEAGRRELVAVNLLALGSEQHERELDLELAARSTKLDAERLARLDPLSALVLAAALEAVSRFGGTLPEATGLVLGTSSATLELNDAYDRRRRNRGARFVEPRRFPATSPNLAPGQVSIALELRGPTFAVGAGHDPAREALLVAHDLVAAGDAAAMIVATAEQVGPVVASIWTAAGWPMPQPGASAVLIGTASGLGRLDRARLLGRTTPGELVPARGPSLIELARHAADVTSLPV